MLLSGMHLGQLAGIPVFTRRQAHASRTYEIAKRLIDVFGAAALMVLCTPIVLISALSVRVSSPGPVFFAHTRIGIRGKPFKIYKLRTMCQNSPPYAKHPDSSDDDRITRIGAWLRRFSIDELPQLYNVLKGDMSLVGPRPEMPFVVQKYDEIQRQRLTVKPGLTGLWQISADRAFSIHENLQYDLFYIERRSASLDMAILFITPFVVLAWKRTT
jgi:lipopolysaccharide/colanic/teichoic acid biosynthesis glycosyltransferase